MSETIGQKLGQARQQKRLSIEQVSAATRIRPHYLEALERDDLSAIPSAAQARGFLRIYADFLGLNATPMPRQSNSQPIVSSPDVSIPPSTDLPAAPVQESVSKPAPARPNLLTNLRERFTRRSASETIVPVASAEPEQPAPEPEFEPARYTEELPARPAPVALEESIPVVEPITKKRSPAKKTASTNNKKPASKTAKISREKPGRKSVVKKKVTNLLPKTSKSHTKRGLSLRKPNSPPTRRVSKKTQSRKPKNRV
ncbi:MAG: helix-turn-helix domain-containing protein [Chloroflexi bacterium]|nr:helix-turn-helix domain-containing protein [Chloroflexota bacterium]MBI3340575.1 helix-turn-helix domain-containing protein [Chloroflexota bacterium]